MSFSLSLEEYLCDCLVVKHFLTDATKTLSNMLKESKYLWTTGQLLRMQEQLEKYSLLDNDKEKQKQLLKSNNYFLRLKSRNADIYNLLFPDIDETEQQNETLSTWLVLDAADCLTDWKKAMPRYEKDYELNFYKSNNHLIYHSLNNMNNNNNSNNNTKESVRKIAKNVNNKKPENRKKEKEYEEEEDEAEEEETLCLEAGIYVMDEKSTKWNRNERGPQTYEAAIDADKNESVRWIAAHWLAEYKQDMLPEKETVVVVQQREFLKSTYNLNTVNTVELIHDFKVCIILFVYTNNNNNNNKLYEGI